MKQDPAVLETEITKLVNRIKESTKLIPEEQLIIRLYSQFGEDVGLLCVYFLNYITLKPYESTFLGANEPHAYISGISFLPSHLRR